MQERNNNESFNTDSSSAENPMANRGHGAQGIDKAPGEETPQDIENTVQQTQRGKNKVDGDLSKESDRPIEQQ